jgi:hypothetical protein
MRSDWLRPFTADADIVFCFFNPGKKNKNKGKSGIEGVNKQKACCVLQ